MFLLEKKLLKLKSSSSKKSTGKRKEIFDQLDKNITFNGDQSNCGESLTDYPLCDHERSKMQQITDSLQMNEFVNMVEKKVCPHLQPLDREEMEHLVKADLLNHLAQQSDSEPITNKTDDKSQS